MPPRPTHTSAFRLNDLRNLYRNYPIATTIVTLLVIGIAFLASDVRVSRSSHFLGRLTDTSNSDAVASSPGFLDPRTSPLIPADLGEIRMANWNIRWFPSGRPEPQDPGAEAITMRSAAKVIRRLEPNILCAEEIRSEEVAKEFARLIRLPDFRLTLDASMPSAEPLALSASSPLAAPLGELERRVKGIEVLVPQTKGLWLGWAWPEYEGEPPRATLAIRNSF